MKPIKLHIQDMGTDKVLFVKKQSYMTQEYLNNLFKRMHESNISDEIFFNVESDVIIENNKGIYVVLMFQNISVSSEQLFNLFRDIDKEYQQNINKSNSSNKDVFVAIGDRNIKMINIDEFLKGLAWEGQQEQPKHNETADAQKDNMLTPFFQAMLLSNKKKSTPKNKADLPNYLLEFDVCPNITEHVLKKMVMDCYTEYIHIMMSLECPPEGIDMFDEGTAIKYLEIQAAQLKDKIGDLLGFLDLLEPLRKNCDDCMEC